MKFARQSIVLLSLLWLSCTALLAEQPGVRLKPEPGPGPSEYIEVADDNWTFVGSRSGRTFMPWGTTLAFPYSRRHPEYKKSGMWNKGVYSLEAIEDAFQAMHRLKLNLVKVALTIDDFLPAVTGSEDFALDPLAVSRFDEVVTLARKYNVRLMVQPPNHWAGSWGKGHWAEEEIGTRSESLDVYCKFWDVFAARYKDEPMIFAWSLCVEKQVFHPAEYLKGVDTWIQAGGIRGEKAAQRKRFILADFANYARETYGTLDAVNQAWETTYSAWEALRPAANVANESRHNYDTQLYRQWVGERWVRRQVDAIRRVDPNHMIGCGIVQRNNPLVRQRFHSKEVNSPASYGALAVRRIAKHLDFLDPHFYPVTFADAQKELEWLKAYLRYNYVGKPLILGEFGHSRKAIVAEWNQSNVEASIGLVSGWMPWQLHNPKGMGDRVTQVSGLVEDDFRTETEWGRVFKSLKRELMLDGRAGIARNSHTPHSVSLDQRRLLTARCEQQRGAGIAYFKELEEIVRLGGANVRFVEAP